MKKSIIILNNILSLVIINMIAMTKSRYVPYGFALTLKELGFKERVLTYYENEVPKLYNDINGWDFNTSFTTCVSRPTFQEAFDWFRDFFNIEVTPVIVVQGDNKWYNISYILPDKDNRYDITNSYEKYDSHKEAEIACLENLIGIVAINNK